MNTKTKQSATELDPEIADPVGGVASIRLQITSTPTRVIDISERDRDVMRLVNNADRNFVSAVQMLKSAMGEHPDYAALMAECETTMKKMAEDVRNAHMNFTVMIKDMAE